MRIRVSIHLHGRVRIEREIVSDLIKRHNIHFAGDVVIFMALSALNYDMFTSGRDRLNCKVSVNIVRGIFISDSYIVKFSCSYDGIIKLVQLVLFASEYHIACASLLVMV